LWGKVSKGKLFFETSAAVKLIHLPLNFTNENMSLKGKGLKLVTFIQYYHNIFKNINNLKVSPGWGEKRFINKRLLKAESLKHYFLKCVSGLFQFFRQLCDLPFGPEKSSVKSGSTPTVADVGKQVNKKLLFFFLIFLVSISSTFTRAFLYEIFRCQKLQSCVTS